VARGRNLANVRGNFDSCVQKAIAIVLSSAPVRLSEVRLSLLIGSAPHGSGRIEEKIGIETRRSKMVSFGVREASLCRDPVFRRVLYFTYAINFRS